ncbi:MAG: transcriptional regulator, partial [Nitratireductor sp.]
MIDRRPFAETHPHLVGFMDFLDDFNRETERGAALAAAAMIDDQLGKIIEAFLVPNKGSHALLAGFNAPLGPFSARIAAAYGLGLISEV